MTTTGSYTPIPDGLWFSELSHAAARILGWIHVRANREAIVEEVRMAWGPESIAVLAELTMAGYLDHDNTSGDRLRYRIVPEAWEALA